MSSFLSQFNKFSIACISVGLLLMAYGYLCRLIPVHFFWESRWLGWEFVLFGVISWLSTRIRQRRRDQHVTIGEQLVRGLLVAFILVQALMAVLIPRTDAFKVADRYMRSSDRLKEEVGDIRYCINIPQGSINESIDHHGSYGGATFIFIVAGTKKCCDVEVGLIKRPGSTEWGLDCVNVN